jgi:hypothetical protein
VKGQEEKVKGQEEKVKGQEEVKWSDSARLQGLKTKWKLIDLTFLLDAVILILLRSILLYTLKS